MKQHEQLRKYNRWQRGDKRLKMPDPKELGEQIDRVADRLEVLERETWGTGKQDVTIEALVAVAEHVARFGRPVEITGPDGLLEYRITVEDFHIEADVVRLIEQAAAANKAIDKKQRIRQHSRRKGK